MRDWADANPDEPWVLGRGWHRDAVRGRAADATAARSAGAGSSGAAAERRRPHGVGQHQGAPAREDHPQTAAPARGAIVPRRPHRRADADCSRDRRSRWSIVCCRHRPQRIATARLRAAIADRPPSRRHQRSGCGRQPRRSSPLTPSARRTGDLQVRVYVGAAGHQRPGGRRSRRLEVTDAQFPTTRCSRRARSACRSTDGAAAAAPANDRRGRRAALRRGHVQSAGPPARRPRLADPDRRRERAVGAGMAFDAYEHAVRSNPDRAAERRHRVEHLNAIGDDDLPRVEAARPARLDCGRSTRPGQDAAALDARSLARRVPTAKGRLAFGSGWPSAPLDPLAALSAMAGRGARRGPGCRPPVVEGGHRRLHVRLGLGVLRRAAQGHHRAGHARRPRRALRRHPHDRRPSCRGRTSTSPSSTARSCSAARRHAPRTEPRRPAYLKINST